MIRVICNKTLKHSDKTTSFNKGSLYVSNYATELSESTILVNNQGQPHRLSLWFKHFRQV